MATEEQLKRFQLNGWVAIEDVIQPLCETLKDVAMNISEAEVRGETVSIVPTEARNGVPSAVNGRLGHVQRITSFICLFGHFLGQRKKSWR